MSTDFRSSFQPDVTYDEVGEFEVDIFKIDVNSYDKKGLTLLHHAIIKKNLEILILISSFQLKVV